MNNTSTASITLVDSGDSGNNTGVVFPPSLLTWTGAVSSDWGTTGNWDLAFVPKTVDSVIIPDVVNDPVLDAARTVADMTLQSGTVLTLNGKDFTATGAFSNDGMVILHGSEAATLAQDTDSGTWKYTGNGNGLADAYILKDFGAVDYFNLTISMVDAGDTIQAASAASIAGTMALASGVFIAPSSDLLVAGNVSIAPSTFIYNGGVMTFNGSGVALLEANHENLGVVVVDGTAKTVQLSGAGVTFGTLSLVSGTYDANGQTTTVVGLTKIMAGGTYLAGSAAQTFNAGLELLGGAFQGSTGLVDVNSDLVLSSGTFTAPSSALSVFGDWARSATAVFNHNNGTVVLDGHTQTVGGSTTFNHLTRITSGFLTFEAGSTQTILGVTTLQGAFGDPLFLRSSLDGTQWKMDPQGMRSVSFVDVKDSNNVHLTPITPTNSHDSGGNANWVFTPAALTWTGAKDVIWEDPANWSLGYRPNTIDSVVIPDVVNDPLLSEAAQVVDLTLQLGSLLALNGQNLIATGIFSNDGTLRLQGNESVGLAQDTDSGMWEYVGDPNGVVDTYAIKDFGAVDYFHLMINDVNVVKNIFTASSGLVLEGSYTLKNGTFTAPSTTMSVKGDFAHQGGVFNHNAGTVVLNGAIQTISGSTTFNHLMRTTVGTLFFEAGSTQTILGITTLQGISTDLLKLRSTILGTQWRIDPQGARNIAYVDVQDSQNINAVSIDPLNSVDSGNNINWFGGIVTIETFTWTGLLSTNWGDPGNWDLNSLPGPEDSVIIPDVTNDPVLDISRQVTELKLKNDALLTLNGRNLTVTGEFHNKGTLKLIGSEVVSLTQDTKHGAFEYAGDGDGLSDIFALLDFGETDYYDLLIRTVDVNEIIQSNAPKAIRGTFTIASGTYDANGFTTEVRKETVVSGGTYEASTAAQIFNRDLRIESGVFKGSSGAVDVNANVFIGSGTLIAPSGSFTISGGWVKRGGTFDPGAYTVTFDGRKTDEDDDGHGGVQNVISGGASFYNLTHAGHGMLRLKENPLTVMGTFTNALGVYKANDLETTVMGPTLISGGHYLAGDATQTFNGGLTISDKGIFTGQKGLVDVNGDFLLTGGEFKAPRTMTLSGNFSHLAGAFHHHSGTVILDGGNQTISGSTKFYNLTKTTSVSVTLTFEAGSSQKILGKLTLRGMAGQLLLLRSSLAGIQWYIDPSGKRDIAYVDVQDSTNTNAKVITTVSSTDSGNNTNWAF
ncbi:MAG: hypothetical protein HY593_03655 [Candidatus Omnitrophica bacterium]|nr:hypothetical protein [Candidatus Omnitrophota bacterium]